MNAALFQLLPAIEHLPAECLKVNLELLYFRSHLFFFLLDVMADTLGQHGKLGRAVVILGSSDVELCVLRLPGS